MTGKTIHDVHGCTEIRSEEYGSYVERVEDDAEAEFFTVYENDDFGFVLALQDFDTRVEAESWAKVKERGDILNFGDLDTPWQVRVIREGDRYGLNGRLIREDGEPCVEFWDMDQFKGVGQFVSRYHLSTVQGIPEGKGLTLDGSVHRWQVSGEGMREVLKFLKEK